MIDHIVENYFCSLFIGMNPSQSYDGTFEGAEFGPFLDNQQKLMATAFEADEIKATIFMMHPRKDPSTNRFYAVFYQ